jgi:hypothetical protein
MRIVMVIAVVVLYVLVPLNLILWLGLRHSASKIDWAVRFLVVGCFMVWLFRAGSWAPLRYYARYVWLLLLAAAALVSFMELRPAPLFISREFWGWTTLGFRAGLILIFAALVFLTFRAQRYPDGAIALDFPLRAGTYYVGNGGSNVALNAHVVAPPQQYALDIAALNRFGRRFSGFLPADVEHYVIYGQTVYSPCDGEVVSVVDGLPDLTPPAIDSAHLAGNHLWVRQQDVYIVLAHLRNGSITVQAGERVARGQPLGHVGNSGNTSEPHLHIHAVKFDVPLEINPGFLLRNGTAVPMLFGGHFLTRNDVFKVDNKSR